MDNPTPKFPKEQAPFSSTGEEWKHIREKISQAQKDRQPESPEAQKDIIKAIVKEHAESYPEEFLPHSYKIFPHEADAYEKMLKNEPHQNQVLKLLDIAKEKGILNAVNIAKKLEKSGKFHLVDDFQIALNHFMVSQSEGLNA